MIPFPVSADYAPASGLLVMGIGNLLLGDEGAGVHALRLLERDCAGVEGVEFVDGGTLGLTLAGLVDGRAALIVLDAAHMDAPPGHCAVFLSLIHI